MNKVFTMMPFALDMNLGRAYNEAMALLPSDDDWNVFLDHDAIWTTREWYRQITEAVARVPNAGIITAIASRGWQSWQWTGQQPDNHDMAWHRKMGLQRLNTKTLLDVTQASGIAGVVMVISKRAWKKVGGFVDGMYCVDHGMHFALADAGYRIYVHEGLYVYHWRRANGDAPPTTAPVAKNCRCLAVRKKETPPTKRIQL